MMIDTFLTIRNTDVSRLALHLANGISEGLSPKRWEQLEDDERMVLALFIHNVIWEIKEHERIETHPEDLLRRCATNFRSYECRGYPGRLIRLCRAFARQFGDFDNLPRREFRLNITDHLWRVYPYTCSAARSDYAARWFKVKKVYSHDEFGCKEDFLGYYVCEELYGLCYLGTNDDVKPEYIQYNEFYTVVPFDNEDEAQFFIVQLVNLLNTGYKLKRNEGGYYMDDKTKDDYIHQAAAQIIRDTIAQAPVEETRMREEYEAQQRKLNSTSNNYVYIFLFENDTIKIGRTNDILHRAYQKRSEAGMNITKICCTKGLSWKQAVELEKKCHNYFADKKTYGEFFKVDFETAKTELESLVGESLSVLENPL